jgi:hypothetical protein
VDRPPISEAPHDAPLLGGGDDEPGGDVAQAQLLPAEEGDGEHGVVGDGGAADGLAAGASRFVVVSFPLTFRAVQQTG